MSNVTEKTKARLCVVEPQQIFHQLYRSIFEADFAVSLLEDAFNEDSVSRIASGLSPDVLLVSARHPDKATIATLSAIRHADPGIGIVLILMHYGAPDIEPMRKLVSANSGGIALFLKQSLDMTDQLIGIVNSVIHGQVVLDPSLSAKLLASQTACPFLEQMTAREQEILQLVATGYTNAAIAETLVIDLKTVEHHINNMYAKLKSTIDFDQKHPRVQAARVYLEATGALLDTRE